MLLVNELNRGRYVNTSGDPFHSESYYTQRKLQVPRDFTGMLFHFHLKVIVVGQQL